MARPSGAARSKVKSVYSIHPGVKATQDWIASLKIKTGRSLDEWTRLIQKKGPAGEKERLEWLKSTHGLGSNTASWLAARSEGKNLEDEDPDAYLRSAQLYIDEMFAGSKASLRPIYDRLLKLGLEIAKDVKACPCKTIVPFYRNHVFAQIKPTTRTRIDLGLALGRTRTPARLITTGGLEKGDRITHRIPIEKIEDTDKDVERWLRVAYDLDA